MIAALALLIGAVAVGWLIPHALRRVSRPHRDPLPLIVAWLVSTAGVLLTAATAVFLLLLPDHGSGVSLLASVPNCWSAAHHGAPPRVEEVAGVVGMALLAAFAARLAVVAVRGVRHRARRRQENLAVLRSVARSATSSSDVLWLAHEQPLAFSMAGHPGVVVATEGLTRHLDPGAVAAVLAHERAHLTGRHHLLVATTDAVRATFPFVPLFRQAPQAIRHLIELAADVAAARDCGPAAVHAALVDVTRRGAPSTSLAMAQDAVEPRLAQLRHGHRPPGRLRRAVSCGLTAVATATLPFLTGMTLFLSVAVSTCPPAG